MFCFFIHLVHDVSLREGLVAAYLLLVVDM